MQEPNSPACSENGTYECGICVCNDGYYGDRCQCDETSVSSETHHDACRMWVCLAVFIYTGRCRDNFVVEKQYISGVIS